MQDEVIDTIKEDECIFVESSDLFFEIIDLDFDLPMTIYSHQTKEELEDKICFESGYTCALSYVNYLLNSNYSIEDIKKEVIAYKKDSMQRCEEYIIKLKTD